MDERRDAKLVLDVWVGARVEKHLDHGSVVERGGEGERGVALRVDRIHFGALAQQQVRHLGVADVRRLDERGLAGDRVAHVDRSIGLQEQEGDVAEAVVRGAVERAVPIAVDLVDVGARVEQRRGDVDVAVPSGQDERGVAVVVLEVDIDLARREQRLDSRQLAVLHRAQEREVPLGAGRLLAHGARGRQARVWICRTHLEQVGGRQHAKRSVKFGELS